MGQFTPRSIKGMQHMDKHGSCSQRKRSPPAPLTFSAPPPHPHRRPHRSVSASRPTVGVHWWRRHLGGESLGPRGSQRGPCSIHGAYCMEHIWSMETCSMGEVHISLFRVEMDHVPTCRPADDWAQTPRTVSILIVLSIQDAKYLVCILYEACNIPIKPFLAVDFRRNMLVAKSQSIFAIPYTCLVFERCWCIRVYLLWASV